MRILFVVTQSEQGGAGRYVADLAHALLPRGEDIFVAAGKGHGNEEGWLFREFKRKNSSFAIPRFADDHFIRLKFLKRPIIPLFDLLAYFELRSLFRRLRPDIIHLNSSKAGIIGSFAARGCGAKVVFTAHGFVWSERLSRLRQAFYRMLERRASAYRDAIITVSDYDRREAIERRIAPAEKITAIHNGINLEIMPHILPHEDARRDIYKFIEAAGILLPKNFRIAGASANLYPTKGIDFLLAAAASIFSRGLHPELFFVVFGEGPERRRLASFIRRLGLSKRFFLLGRVPDAFRYLRGFDVFVLSSTKEGFPYALLEARLANTPIVATRVGGVPEIVDERSGVLVPPADPKALAEALMETLARPRPHGLFPAEFSLSRMVDETLALYERLL